MKRVARYADCCLLYMSCLHVEPTCPHHHLVHSICKSNTSFDDVPPPCDDSVAGEEEQHNAWNHVMEHAPGQQPTDTAMFKRGGTMQDGTDVPLRTGRYLYVHGVVTSRGNRGTPWRIWAEWRGWWRGWLVLHIFPSSLQLLEQVGVRCQSQSMCHLWQYIRRSPRASA